MHLSFKFLVSIGVISFPALEIKKLGQRIAYVTMKIKIVK